VVGLWPRHCGSWGCDGVVRGVEGLGAGRRGWCLGVTGEGDVVGRELGVVLLRLLRRGQSRG